MARKRGTKDAYTGRSGQRAVMAELLLLECNVAIPDVDVGEDVFAFRDGRAEVAHLQVKTAQATRYKKGEGYAAKFGLPLKQLERPDNPPLYYALAVRLGRLWVDFLVICRGQVQVFWNASRSFGSENSRSGDLELYLQFRPGRVRCGAVELEGYRNAWEQPPPFRPLPDVGAVADPPPHP